MVANHQSFLSFAKSFTTMCKVPFIEGLCKEFPSEVIKICLSELEAALLQKRTDDEIIVVCKFLTHCHVYKGIPDDVYHKSLEIVLNSFAISIDQTKFECFKTLFSQNYRRIELPSELTIRTHLIQTLLNNSVNKTFVRVSQEIFFN